MQRSDNEYKMLRRSVKSARIFLLLHFFTTPVLLFIKRMRFPGRQAGVSHKVGFCSHIPVSSFPPTHNSKKRLKNKIKNHLTSEELLPSVSNRKNRQQTESPPIDGGTLYGGKSLGSIAHVAMF